LYEGIVKLLSPDWSAWGYLMNSTGFLSGVFQGMAQNDALLSVVNFLNVWGLILIGLGLDAGIVYPGGTVRWV
jgi:thiosulfate dehydrogenase (quinone) large subunit